MATSRTPNRQNPLPKAFALFVLAAGAILLAAAPAGATTQVAAGSTCVLGQTLCVEVHAGSGGSGACIHESGGTTIKVDRTDGVVVYYPDGSGYSHSGVSGSC
ncbi:MAG: hypothetical protein ACYC2H_04320 [Thermoplasmatota archaeon]